MNYKYILGWIFIGAAVGLIMGTIKSEAGIWFGVGAGIGFLIGLFLKKSKIGPEKAMWFGFFLVFPVTLFSEYFRGTFWFDVFGITAVIGTIIVVINFVKMLKKQKERRKAQRDKKQQSVY